MLSIVVFCNKVLPQAVLQKGVTSYVLNRGTNLNIRGKTIILSMRRLPLPWSQWV